MREMDLNSSFFVTPLLLIDSTDGSPDGLGDLPSGGRDAFFPGEDANASGGGGNCFGSLFLSKTHGYHPTLANINWYKNYGNDINHLRSRDFPVSQADSTTKLD